MEKILVIGGTGNIGSAVVKYLHQAGTDFTTLVRNPEKQKNLEERGIQCISGDYTDKISLNRTMAGISRLFLVTTPHENMANHEKNIIDIAFENGVGHVVKVSVIGADHNSPTHLGKSHAQVEQHLIASGLSYTILRPHTFMQNILGNLATIKDHGAMYGTIGEGTVPMIDARDIGEAAAHILMEPGTHHNKTYLLTGPQSISYQEVAKTIGDVIGKDVNYITVPDEAARASMLGMGFPAWLIEDLLTLNRLFNSGIGKEVSYDLESILGHPPGTVKGFISDHAFLFR